MSLFGLLRYFVPVAVAPALGFFCFNPPTLLLQTVSVRHHCSQRHLPPPHQVKSRLLPPSHIYLVPPTPSTLSHTGPESVASQYTEWPYYAFAECRFSLDQNLTPLSPPPLRYTPTYHPTSAVASTLSVVSPPVLGNPPGPVPYRG